MRNVWTTVSDILYVQTWASAREDIVPINISVAVLKIYVADMKYL
jgi:hypothetical protein